jgi:hypothetical protein
VPAFVSLAVIALLIGGSVVASLLKARSLEASKEAAKARQPPPGRPVSDVP